MMMFHDANLLGVFVVMSVFIRSHKDNYCTIIPSIYVQLDDSVDCSLCWCHVGTDDLVHG